MRTLVRHRRHAAMRRFRIRRARTMQAPARQVIVIDCYRVGRVRVPDFVPVAWLGEPTMNYAVVPYAPSDPWSGHPLRWGWR